MEKTTLKHDQPSNQGQCAPKPSASPQPNQPFIQADRLQKVLYQRAAAAALLPHVSATRRRYPPNCSLSFSSRSLFNEIIRDVHRRVNEHRSRRGLPPLKFLCG